MNELSPNEIMRSMPEMAQICHFCKVFRTVFHLPSFSRSDLELSLIHSENEYGTPNALLAEIHYKLCKDYGGHKTDKILESWEGSLRHRIKNNWRGYFDENPMKDISYIQLTIQQRVLILNSLCQWRLNDSEELQQYITTLTKQDDGFDFLRPKKLGMDDNGRIYWYFGDECWVYCEDSHIWNMEKRNKEYSVSYASNKSIRLHIDYDLDIPKYSEMNIKTNIKDEKNESIELNQSEIPNENEVLNEKEHIKDEKFNDTMKNEVSQDSLNSIKEETEEKSFKMEKKENVEDSDIVSSDSPSDSTSSKRRSSRKKIQVKRLSLDISQEKSQDDDAASASDSSEKSSNNVSTSEIDISSEEHIHEDKNINKRKRRTSTEEEPNFMIECDRCHISYDMRKLDPPLKEKPEGEWQCLGCLVNNARGWPLRRRRRDSSPKRSKISNPIDSKQIPNTTQSSNKSNSKKKSSKKKKQKRKKEPKAPQDSDESPSIGKRLRSRRRPTSVSPKKTEEMMKEEYIKMKESFHSYLENRKKREEMELERQDNFMECPLGPSNWTVVCSTLQELEDVINSLEGGTKLHEELRENLRNIYVQEEHVVKAQEKKRLQQQLWQVLPRRQSSRIAQAHIKRQVQNYDERDLDDSYEDNNSGHAGNLTRSQRYNNRQTPEPSEEEKQEQAKRKLEYERAQRAQRRRGDEIPIQNAESTNDANPSVIIDDWIQWSDVKQETHPLKKTCLSLIQYLMKNEKAYLFSRPVDPVLDGCPDYGKVVKRPMDLGTIRTRILTGFYQMWEIFKQDVERVWGNCRLYNAAESIIVAYANELDTLYKNMVLQAEKNGVLQFQDILSEDEKSKGSVSSDNHSESDSNTWTNEESENSSDHESSENENYKLKIPQQQMSKFEPRNDSVIRKKEMESNDDESSSNKSQTELSDSDVSFENSPKKQKDSIRQVQTNHLNNEMEDRIKKLEEKFDSSNGELKNMDSDNNISNNTLIPGNAKDLMPIMKKVRSTAVSPQKKIIVPPPRIFRAPIAPTGPLVSHTRPSDVSSPSSVATGSLSAESESDSNSDSNSSSSCGE